MLQPIRGEHRSRQCGTMVTSSYSARGGEEGGRNSRLKASSAARTGCVGRALSRRVGIAHRPEQRLQARFRREVVGRVRVRGQGPPAHLGPLRRRRPPTWPSRPRRSSGPTDPGVDEPFDEAMRWRRRSGANRMLAIPGPNLMAVGQHTCVPDFSRGHLSSSRVQ